MNSNTETTPPQKSPLKNPFLYSSLALLVVALYVGYIMLSRHESLRDSENHAAAQLAEKRRVDDREAIEQLGGSELSIRALYLSPEVIIRGQSSQLCYDVSNAKTVTPRSSCRRSLAPPTPACIDLKPTKTTTYTLTITSAAGQAASQSIELKVK